MPMARGELLFEAYPYYVERDGTEIVLSVQDVTQPATIKIMTVPNREVGADFARLLCLSRYEKLPVQFSEP